MSSIGQQLTLLSGASGPVTGPAMQWFGGKAYLFAWASGGATSIEVDVSPDGGTTWFQEYSFPTGNFNRAVLNEPALMLRARASGSIGINVIVIGYDQAE